MLLGYAAYNVVNILYLFEPVSTINFVIGLASMYLIVRGVRFFSPGRGGLTQPEGIAIALIALLGLVVLMQNIFHEPYISSDGVEVVSTITTLTQVAVLWFLIGGVCSNFDFKPSDLVALLIAFFIALCMYLATDENLTIPFQMIQAEAGVNSVSHLILEKHVILLLVFAFSMSVRFKYVCVVLGLCSLFFMGGRTSLFVFMMVSTLLLIKGNTVTGVFVIAIFAIVAAVMFQYGVEVGFIDLEAKAVREILFLEGVEEDSSFQGRVNLYKTSMPLLADQVWIGNYSLTVDRAGYFSGYIHNLLSAWQFYGLFVFLAIVCCLSYCVRRMVYALKYSGNPSDIFGGFLLVYVILSVVLAKYAAWHLLWFTLGFWLLRAPLIKDVKLKKKRRKRRRSSAGLDSDWGAV